MSLRVAIAGAGIGGLCLAQGLRRAGIEVAVYEQDPAALARGQGYRLRLDHEGHAALRSCLPDDLFALHESAGIQLRVLSNLWPLWDAVVASTLGFSGIRMRNATSRPRSGGA